MLFTQGEVSEISSITKITQQKKNQDYYNIYIDEEYAFSIHGELVILHGIKKGKKVDVKELEAILQEDAKKRALNACLHYLSYTRRTQWQLEEYLRKKEYDQGVIEGTIEKLKYYNMIDDEAYVKAFIQEKKLGNPTGRKKIHYDLKNKGIPEGILNNLDQWFSEEDEYIEAKRLAEKYNKKYLKHPLRERKQKIGQAGQRRGFSWQLMKTAIGEIIQDSEEEGGQYSQEIDRDKAIEWATKYKGRYEKKGLKGYPLKQKIAQAMMGRGYRWEMIEEILREILI